MREPGFGDPDYDFGFLGGQIGEVATRVLAACYEHPDPERLMRKVRLFTLLDAVDAVVDGPGRAPQREIDRAWERLRTLR